eukprot:TRINITY_DN21493_c0_g1_i1.p1 TRINITY_DN21493_c0_g1~~TRINITY_DN21493_c0_g1_i1.p1  ORF type:complete len:264 (+),score=43.71 TRINITY_DN21493_c0_g1_i1:29-820(+)
MKVIVGCLSGDEVELDMEGDCTIVDLKANLAEQWNVPVLLQSIINAGLALDDDITLASLGHTQEGPLHVSMMVVPVEAKNAGISKVRGIIAELRTHKGSQAAAHAIIGILESCLRKPGENWGQLRKDGLHVLCEIMQNECAGAVAALLEVGYTPADLDLAGFGGTSIYQLKDAGYSAAQMKDAGYSDSQLMWSGYNAAQMKDAGYSAAQLKNVGYSIHQVMDAGYSTAQMEGAYSIDQLKDAGISANGRWWTRKSDDRGCLQH